MIHVDISFILCDKQMIETNTYLELRKMTRDEIIHIIAETFAIGIFIAAAIVLATSY